VKQPIKASAEVRAFLSAIGRKGRAIAQSATKKQKYERGHKGGTARAKSTTKAQRHEWGLMAAAARWKGTTKAQRHEEALVRTRKAAVTRAKNKKEKQS